MKKIVLTFGLISGAVSSVIMLATQPFMDRIGYDKALIVGYTAMVLSFLLVFFGIRSYRENVGGGKVSFGRAFAVGILITLVSCAIYVVTWEILYFVFQPDFCDKYANYMVEKARASGASQAAIDAQIQEMETFKALMKNPLTNAALAFTEPLPVGLIMTLFSAGILRRKG